jgi:stage V sporulation protein AF
MEVLTAMATGTKKESGAKESAGSGGKIDARDLLTEEELGLKEMTEIPKRIEEIERALEEKMALNVSFDVVFREMVFGSKRTAFLYINGFAKDAIMTEVIERLTYLERDQIVPDTVNSLLKKFVAHIQVKMIDDFEEAVEAVLKGEMALFIENERKALLIDAKNFPVRSIEEPDLERVVRGSRDGFTETLLTNVTLVRRRIRDPRLKLELMKVGRRTQTDVCLAYISDIADPELVESIRDKINKIDVDGIPLGDKQLEEWIIGKGWNPYPSVRYSERPDVVSSHLLEGHVVVFSDTSPSVMILPTTFFHLMEHAEEYRQTPFIGSYLRWIRFFGIFASLFLLPLWFLFVTNPELKPEGLEFLGPQEEKKIPLLGQFLIVEIGLDLMRMAAVHTPQPLAVALGLVAAILIGEIAVDTGLVTNEVIMYLSVAAVGMFATPSYELGLANRIVRLALIVLVALFKIPGFVIGTTLWLILLSIDRSYNSPYMWPFIPFNAKALFAMLLRRPAQSNKFRPGITKAADNTRQGSE